MKHSTEPRTLKRSTNVGLSHPVHRLLQFQSSWPRVFSQPLCDHQALQALICSTPSLASCPRASQMLRWTHSCMFHPEARGRQLWTELRVTSEEVHFTGLLGGPSAGWPITMASSVCILALAFPSLFPLSVLHLCSWGPHFLLNTYT